MILKNDHDEVLIVRANYKNYWTFPGGIIDAGETPKEASIRETYEEVGIDVDSDAVSFVAVVNRRSSYAQTYQFVFSAPLTTSSLDHVVLQASEIEEYALVTMEQVMTDDRRYGKVIQDWARGNKAYIEQTLDT